MSLNSIRLKECDTLVRIPLPFTTAQALAAYARLDQNALNEAARVAAHQLPVI